MKANSITSIALVGWLTLPVSVAGAVQASGVSALAGASMLMADPIGRSGDPLPPQVQRVGEPSAAGTMLPTASSRSTISITTAEAASYLRNTQGRVSVVIIYATNCPRSRSMFPGFVTLAGMYASENVAFTAIDVAPDGGELLPHFLARYNAPFEPIHIRDDYEDNSMGRDMAPFGLEIHRNETYHLPYTAVLDRSGNAVAQWDGTPSLRAVDAAIRSQL